MDLEPGKPLTLPDVGLVPMRRAEMAARNLPPDTMANPSQIIGRMLRVPMKKGDPFTPDKFYPDGAGPSIAERLKPGQRAVTIAITGADAIAGFAVPGSMVDVVFRSKALPPDEPEETMTLIQDAEILALGNNSVIGKLGGINTGSALNPVTLAVNADDASKLILVEGKGDLSLTLRSPTDEKVSNVARLSLDELLQRKSGWALGFPTSIGAARVKRYVSTAICWSANSSAACRCRTPRRRPQRLPPLRRPLKSLFPNNSSPCSVFHLARCRLRRR